MRSADEATACIRSPFNDSEHLDIMTLRLAQSPSLPASFNLTIQSLTEIQ